MKKTIKIGLLFAVVWMLIKLAFHATLPTESSLKVSVFINILLLLTAIAVGLFYHKKEEGFTEGNTLSDIKAAMTSGIPYTILVSIFIYLYYNNINPDFNKLQISAAKKTIELALNNPMELAKIKTQNEAFEVMTKEKMYKELVKGPKNFYKASSTALISLLSLIMLSTVYSILVTVVYRKVLVRKI